MNFPFFAAMRARLWKPGWRLFTVMTVLLVLHGLWTWMEARRFQRVLGHIEGEPNQPQLSWLTVPPEDNAGRYYEATWALAVPERRPWARRDEAAWRKAMQPALEMLDRAASLPSCAFSPYVRYMPSSIAPAKAASLRTRELIERKDWNGAVASVTTSLRYLRAFSTDVPRVTPHSRPDVVEIVLADIELLIEAPSSPDLRGVRDLIDAENRLNHLERALRIERHSTERRLLSETSADARWFSVGLERWLLRPVLWRVGRSALEFQSGLIEAARSPWPDRIQRFLHMPPPRSLFVRTSWGWLLPEGALRIARTTAKSHAMAVCLRIEEYRRTHGTSPETLDALRAATGEPELPVDPFTGKPLQYRREADGYVVYSVGEDGTDDGGVVLKRQGSAPDYGFRIRIRGNAVNP